MPVLTVPTPITPIYMCFFYSDPIDDGELWWEVGEEWDACVVLQQELKECITALWNLKLPKQSSLLFGKILSADSKYILYV